MNGKVQESLRKSGDAMIYHKQIVYSLEALGYLASRPNNKHVNVKELAEELHIPRHFLGKVLTELVKRELVTSTKGPSGGFRLAVNAESTSLYRILAVLGGLTKLESTCIMGTGACKANDPCALHELWLEFREKAVSKTQKLTLEEFSQTFTNKLPSVNAELRQHKGSNISYD